MRCGARSSDAFVSDVIRGQSASPIANGTLYLEYTRCVVASLRRRASTTVAVCSAFEAIKRAVPADAFAFSDPLREEQFNVWLGDGRTVGRLHFDEFDNLLTQLSGKKTFLIYVGGVGAG